GQGGYDVKVKEHTQLDGAVIASQADKEKNRLDTGTLGWTDIHNQADYSATHSGGSLSTGGPVGGDLLTNMAGGMLSGANNSGHAEGTTKAGVSEGTLIVRDTDKQQQDVAQLNRDTEHANDGSISPIFNKEKEQNRLKQAQLIGEIGGQAMDVIRTQGDIAGLKAQKNSAALAQAREQLEKSGKPTNDAAVMKQAYDNAMRQYGTGSDLQKAAQAVTGALTALAGNNLAGALASGASPYLATEIKKLTTNPLTGEVDVAANAMAHAVLGAVTAQLNNQSAAAGGLGAGGGELAARYIAGQLFPGKTAEQLSESERQQVSTLSQLAAGLAGGLATGDTAGAVTGGQAGKNAVENNALSATDDKKRQDAKWSLPYLEGDKKHQAEKLISDLNAKDKAFDAKLDAACKGLSSTACQGMRQELTAMAKSYDEKLDGQYVGNMGSVYKEGKGQVDALMWQYASADAKAEREANVNRIAENWGVSKETAANLYDGMAVVHTTAAIGGAVYGMMEKPTGVDTAKPSKPTAGRTPEPNRIAADEEASGWSQYDHYRNGKGDWNWPAKLGFAEEPVQATLPVGTRLDRYGKTNGSFLSPQGTPQEQRALAPGSLAEQYHQYEVIKPLPVIQGKIAPAFGEPGGGIQILPDMKERVDVQWLLDNKYIRKVN
ncbi:glycohydrolase toxin TNT-related protein, partial [Serratia nevei]